MNALQNFKTRWIETFVSKKQASLHGELISAMSSGLSEGTPGISDVLEVLVIDGSYETGHAKVEMIHRLGHAARWAGDGHEGLRMAVEHRPKAVMLNIKLPALNGYEVAKHLRTDFPNKNILIIGIAASGDNIPRQRCDQAAIDLVLQAPIDSEVIETLFLLECVRQNRLRTHLPKQSRNNEI